MYDKAQPVNYLGKCCDFCFRLGSDRYNNPLTNSSILILASVERNGVVTNPLAGQAINIAPELSWNTEIGWRGGLLQGRLDGQLTYFNNTSRNFYAGGRNEVFRQLGKIHVQGLETALQSKVIEQNDF